MDPLMTHLTTAWICAEPDLTDWLHIARFLEKEYISDPSFLYLVLLTHVPLFCVSCPEKLYLLARHPISELILYLSDWSQFPEPWQWLLNPEWRLTLSVTDCAVAAESIWYKSVCEGLGSGSVSMPVCGGGSVCVCVCFGWSVKGSSSTSL